MLLRSFLLYLSNRKHLRNWMETSRTAGRLTSRFVAGLTLDEELAVCRRLEQDGILATLDRLGESVTTAPDAASARDGYLEALRKIHDAGLGSTVSIKLTQFGMDLGGDVCAANVEKLVREAARLNNRVEIDMESSEYVDRTLAIVRAMHTAHHNVRAVIQAYLYRSEKDVDRLSELGVPVRLCKGAYREPAAVAFQRKSDVDANYVRLMQHLLETGAYPAIATHDARIIAQAERLVRRKAIPADRFEFQMLYDIRRDLSRRLARAGYRMRLYVPYGDAWYPYFMRRLAERPANLLFLARNLLHP
jgi:proline dehydrogenase